MKKRFVSLFIAVMLSVTAFAYALPAAALDSGLKITRQPVNVTIPYGEYTRLFITAKANAGNIVAYQWYRSRNGDTDNVIKIQEKTENNLGVYPDECGIFYYFCAAQAKNMSGKVAEEIYSDVIAVTVTGVIQNKNIFDDLTCNPAETVEVPYVFKCWGATSMQMIFYKNDSRSFENAAYVTEQTVKADEVSGKVALDTDEPSNTYYYFTVNALDAKGLVIQTINSPIFKLRVRGGFDMVGQPKDASVNVGESASLSCYAEIGGGAEILYQWFSCSDRQCSDAEAIEGATGTSLDVDTDTVGKAYYYCEAYSGEKRIMSDVAKVTVNEPVVAVVPDHGELPFTDVSVGHWYYSDLLIAYGAGLINGKSEDTFAPESCMTVAEAIKLAVCMNETYLNGEIGTVNYTDDPSLWYKNYVGYAIEHGIIDGEFENYNADVTRTQFAAIFSRALPDEAFAAVNEVADGSIPDVADDSAVYKLYRAGILRGNDDSGTFAPDSFIKRSEVAVILTRMMYTDKRVSVTLPAVGEAAAEETADETTNTEETTSDVTSETTISEETTSETTVAEETTSDTTAEETTSETTAAEETTSDTTAAEETISDTAAGESTQP